jgi:AcrR family transcriptional regulator
MSGKTNVVRESGATRPSLDRRTLRREATRREIVGAAWEIARANGLSGLSMRDLGDRVGMRAQSVYSYFASKDEIYDAMFREGYEAFIAWMNGYETPIADARQATRQLAHRFFAFCTTDPVRYQLLFLRTIPGFEPSAESYAVAVRALTGMQTTMARFGVTDPDASDLATALFTGLTSQQIANDPGGDRWERLVDRAADMLLTEVAPDLLITPHDEESR